MADLGEFGAALKELSGEVDHFKFMGARFEVRNAISPWLVMKFSAASTGKLAEDEGMATVMQVFESALGDEQFGSFDRLAVGCDMDELIRLGMGIFQAQAARPTEEPSGSSPKPLSISPSSSSESSLSPVSQTVAPAPAVALEQEPVREPTVLSTAERVARMRPVDELLTG